MGRPSSPHLGQLLLGDGAGSHPAAMHPSPGPAGRPAAGTPGLRVPGSAAGSRRGSAGRASSPRAGSYAPTSCRGAERPRLPRVAGLGEAPAEPRGGEGRGGEDTRRRGRVAAASLSAARSPTHVGAWDPGLLARLPFRRHPASGRLIRGQARSRPEASTLSMEPNPFCSNGADPVGVQRGGSDWGRPCS